MSYCYYCCFTSLSSTRTIQTEKEAKVVSCFDLFLKVIVTVAIIKTGVETHQSAKCLRWGLLENITADSSTIGLISDCSS